MQTIRNTQGQCAEDEDGSRAAFESAIATGQRAVELLRDLEQVLAWDQEYGFRRDRTVET
ncbi:MAG TPA: hypothetical protein VML92_07380 [Steroidobacteraceae bacterium]|nr:hypothetical protein [Steroidobacteraceae bacterium]